MFSRVLCLSILALFVLVASATAQAPNPPPPAPPVPDVVYATAELASTEPYVDFQVEPVLISIGFLQPLPSDYVLRLADGRQVAANTLTDGVYSLADGFHCQIAHGSPHLVQYAVQGVFLNRQGNLKVIRTETQGAFEQALAQHGLPGLLGVPRPAGIVCTAIGMWPNGSHPEWPKEFEDRFQYAIGKPGVYTFVSPELGQVVGQIEVRETTPQLRFTVLSGRG